MKRLILITGLLLLFTFLKSQPGWNWQNPLPQGNELKAVSMKGTHWAVGAYGTVLHHILPGDYWEVVDIGTIENLNDIDINSISKKGWIVGDNGTIFYTEDMGESWVKQNIGTSVNLHSVSVNSDACVWACGDRGTVIKATCNDLIWEDVSPPQQLNLYSISAYHCNEAWAVGVDGFIISTENGGQTWTSHNGGTSWDLFSIDSWEGAFTSRACGKSGIIISKAWDSQTWQKENESLDYQLNSIETKVGQSGYAVGSEGIILMGTDGGANWVQKSTGFNWDLNDISSIALEEYTYQVVGQYGIMLKNDGYDSEFKIVNNLFWHWIQSIEFVNQFTGWAVGGDSGWGGTTDGIILKTTDGGETWEIKQNLQTPLTDMDFINEYKGWAVGRNGLIKATSSGGESWVTQNGPIGGTLTSVCFTDENNGWIVSMSNFGEIIHTTNGGNSWTKQTNTSGNPLHDVFFINQKTGWAVGLDTTIIRTIDGGQNWLRVAPYTVSGARYTSVFFIDEFKGWVVGSYGTIVITEDGGITWHQVESGITESLESVYFIDKNNGWAVGDRGAVLRSVDGGYTWFKQKSGVATNTLTSVHFTDALNGWIVGEGGTIMHTSNGGFIHDKGTLLEVGLGLPITDNEETRSTIEVDLSEETKSGYILTGIEVYIDTIFHSRVSDLEITLTHNEITDTLVFHVNDDGENFLWTVLKDQAVKTLDDGLAPFSGEYKPYQPLSVFDGTDPAGEWTLSIFDNKSGETGYLYSWGIKPVFEKTTAVVDIFSGTADAKIILEQNIPNPFSATTQINWESKINGNTQLILYNSSGQGIEIFINENIPVGKHSRVIDGSHLSPGMYFYQLRVEKHVQTKKFIIQN